MTRVVLALLVVTTATALTADSQQAPAAPAPASQVPAARPQAPGPVSVGHTFNRRTNLETLERDDSPERRDSWNRVWTFFEWHLRPYDARPQPRGSVAR